MAERLGYLRQIVRRVEWKVLQVGLELPPSYTPDWQRTFPIPETFDSDLPTYKVFMFWMRGLDRVSRVKILKDIRNWQLERIGITQEQIPQIHQQSLESPFGQLILALGRYLDEEEKQGKDKSDYW